MGRQEALPGDGRLLSKIAERIHRDMPRNEMDWSTMVLRIFHQTGHYFDWGLKITCIGCTISGQYSNIDYHKIRHALVLTFYFFRRSKPFVHRTVRLVMSRIQIELRLASPWAKHFNCKHIYCRLRQSLVC